MKRVLDKIRLVRTFPKNQGYKKYNAHIGAAHNLVGTNDFAIIHEERHTVFYKGFKGKGEKNGLRISFGSSSIGTYIAVECTPNKLTSDEWIEVRAYLQSIFGGPEVVASEFRLFEIEFALDISHPMKELVVFAPKLRKLNLGLQGSGQIEIGSKHGNRWIRIYDKRKQLAEDKGISLVGPLTRIEYVLRRLPKPLTQCYLFSNPFNDLIVVRKELVPEIRKQYLAEFGLRHFCDKVLKGATGHIAYWDVEDAGMRKRICKLLKPYVAELNSHKLDWDSWVSAELSNLRQKFEPD